jgi:hypothetical protein
MGTWLRDIHTTQERREWFDYIDALAEYPEWVRKRRSMKELPSAWDDIPRSDSRDRSWKRHRKTQYRPKVEKTHRRQPSGPRGYRIGLGFGRTRWIDYRVIHPFRMPLRYQKMRLGD